MNGGQYKRSKYEASPSLDTLSFAPGAPPPVFRLGSGLRKELFDLQKELDSVKMVDTLMEDSPSGNASQEEDSFEDRSRVEAGLDTLKGGMKKMVDVVNKLRAAGIEGLGFGLPRIAVVGDQSAGKSSLIEAISGIKVPRYVGTCTRCPLEINLSESENEDARWHCKISLRFNKKYQDNYVGYMYQGSRNPWVEQPLEQHLFLELTSKDEVEPALIRAQKAILNPSRRWRDFTQDTGELSEGAEEFEVKFSPNVVCMEITAPGLPNLAFIDLPGVIQTTETDSEDYLIGLVTDLVKEYIKEEDCLVLLAMTMKNDAVNQSAARLAREMGEERTIGALTKPDTVGAGEFQQWIEILRGKSHKLKHGYFVTKQPDQGELKAGITHQEARERERQFFATRKPWCTDLKDMCERFGTGALTAYLAEKLGECIRMRLPGIIDNITRQAEDIQTQLQALPYPTTDNHLFIIQHLIAKFTSITNEYLKGGTNGSIEKGSNQLQLYLRGRARAFNERLRELTPDIIWVETEEEEAENHAAPAVGQRMVNTSIISLLDSDDDTNNMVSNPLKKATLPVVQSTPITPRKRKSGQTSNIGPDSTTSTTGGGAGSSSSSTSRRRQKKSHGQHHGHRFTLLQVRETIHSTGAGLIPDQVDSKAIEHIAKRAISNWQDALHDYVDGCGEDILRVVEEIFNKKFYPYQRTLLYQESHSILNTYLNRLFLTQSDSIIHRIYQLEKDQIATLNEEDFKALKKRHLERLSEQRGRNREEQRELRRRRLQADSSLNPRKRAAEEKKLVASEQSRDKFENEIELIAAVCAYYELATKRFVDNVYLAVQGEWVVVCRRGIAEELWKDLGLKDSGDIHERCKTLLEEDPEKARKRKELEGKMAKLKLAMEELRLL